MKDSKPFNILEFFEDFKREPSPSAQPILDIRSQWTSIMAGDFSVVLVRFRPRRPVERPRFIRSRVAHEFQVFLIRLVLRRTYRKFAAKIT